MSLAIKVLFRVTHEEKINVVIPWVGGEESRPIKNQKGYLLGVKKILRQAQIILL